MKIDGNTTLVTGGGSGIGRGLAEAFQRIGNHVIIAGRRQSVLDEVTAANPGMRSAVLDIDDAGGIRTFGRTIAEAFPELNVLVNNAGIQRPESLQTQPDDLAAAEAMVTTNLLGPIRLTAALLPLLLRQRRSAIANVTSGLAFVPGAGVPTYSATKAAMHAYTLAIRHQLRKTSIDRPGGKPRHRSKSHAAPGVYRRDHDDPARRSRGDGNCRGPVQAAALRSRNRSVRYNIRHFERGDLVAGCRQMRSRKPPFDADRLTRAFPRLSKPSLVQ